MLTIKILWWLCLSLVIYTYIGYAVFLRALVGIKRIKEKKREKVSEKSFQPEVTLIVTAYNESDCISEKINNTFAIDYPKDKINYLFVTDGSDDDTPLIVSNYPQIKHLHQKERKGKIAAVQRAIHEVKTPIVVFTDANTFLNPEAINRMVDHFKDPQTGAVAGEKRVFIREKDTASGAGEGMYWKYESKLKEWDAELFSVVGAAGELFAIRNELYETVPEDTIIEDFYLTLRIAQKGYRVAYEPNAYALEAPSASVKEELKRKIRIAAGGIQSIIRLKSLLNFFHYGLLSFQYISHRVLRWTLTPLALILLFVFNFFLLNDGAYFYRLTMYLQILFYSSALIGFVLENKAIKITAFFIPYYFFIMNYAVLRGIIRYLTKSQTVIWERAKRSSYQ